jgi:Transposase IS66 family
MTVLGGQKPGSHTGRFWAYIGPSAFPYDVYDFTENRKRDGPAQFLADYAGYLHADAFSGYDGIYTGSASLDSHDTTSTKCLERRSLGAVLALANYFTPFGSFSRS